MQRKILLIDGDDVRSALDWPQLLEVTRAALIDLNSPQQPGSISAQLAVPGASLHVKAGAVADPLTVSLKANLRPDAGSADGAVLLFDPVQRALRAVLASGDLTAMRTAAIAGIAAAALGTSPDTTVALVGAGPVARCVEQVLAHLGLGAELRVWSRSEEHAKALVEEALGAGERRACATVSEAVRGAGLVITCTPARTALVEDKDLSPTAVVLAMGADSPGKRELGEGVLDAATLLADVPADALAVGEFAYLPESDGRRVTSLGQCLSRLGEAMDAGRVVVDSVGSSAVDAAVCAMVLRQVTTASGGTWVNF